MDRNDAPTDLDAFLVEFWDRFTTAESAGDFTGVAPLCADDLVFQSPSEEPYESLAALSASWWKPPAGYTITFNHAQLVAADRLAVQRGVATDRFAGADGEELSHRYNYLAVFGADAAGWKLTHFISNMID